MLTRGGTVKLQIHSNFDMLDFVQVVSDRMGHLAGLDDDAIHWIGVAVRESVINAIKHGNANDKSKNVQLSLSLKDSLIKFVVKDEGSGFDYQNLPDPTAPENIEKIGGRGIFLMKHLSDEVEFKDRGRVVELSFYMNA